MSRTLINHRMPARDSWPSAALRRLGSFEHLFWLMDQDRPIHFGLVAQISGNATPAQWRRALVAVQRRHPLLSAYIEADDNGAPRFRESAPVPIPLRVIPGDPGSDWHHVLAEELVMPFNFRDAPLVRAVLIQGEGRAALVLLMHHAIGDSLAAAYVIRDALLALAGDSLEALPITPSQDDLLPDDVAPRQPQNGAALPAPPQPPPPPASHAASATSLGARTGGFAIPKVQSLRVSAEFTARLRARARQEGSSVHAALCAALAIAGREIHSDWRDNPLRILSPIETRTMQDIGEGCGCYLAHAMHLFQPGAAEFWDLARLAKSDVSRSKTPENVGTIVREVQGALAGGLDVEGISDFVATAFVHDALISNIGELGFPSQFGSLKLEAIWGPAVLGRFPQAQFLGVATLDGSLCLTHTSQAPLPALLETMHRTLAKACSR